MCFGRDVFIFVRPVLSTCGRCTRDGIVTSESQMHLRGRQRFLLAIESITPMCDWRKFLVYRFTPKEEATRPLPGATKTHRTTGIYKCSFEEVKPASQLNCRTTNPCSFVLLLAYLFPAYQKIQNKKQKTLYYMTMTGDVPDCGCKMY